MNKISFALICVVSFLFTGCVKPSAFKNNEYNEFYTKSLQYTKKNDIVVDGNVIAMLNATYLNETGENIGYKNHETFLIGVFTANNDSKNISSDDKYKILLNDINPISMEKLEKNSYMYKKMPLYNPWAKYYIVKFDKKEIKSKFLKSLTKKEKYSKFDYENIELKLLIDDGKSSTLTYQKAL
jgi:hypothetical protein